MQNIVYFDLETQKTANDVGGWHRKDLMRMSVGVTYSSASGEYRIYREEQVEDLIMQLRTADLVVGYNILHFDLPVLMGYTVLDLTYDLSALDLLLEVENKISRRLSLDALAGATLGAGKIATGIDAVRWWREGKLEEIAEYCCMDVKVTRLLHQYGLRTGELWYQDGLAQRQRIAVNWDSL